MKLIYPNISLGTVYRNLSLLADLGEIKKLSSFAGADHFDGRTERHCHFMCIRCERIIDLESEGIHHIMDLAGENFKGKITDYSARFFGLCERQKATLIVQSSFAYIISGQIGNNN